MTPTQQKMILIIMFYIWTTNNMDPLKRQTYYKLTYLLSKLEIESALFFSIWLMSFGGVYGQSGIECDTHSELESDNEHLD